MAKMKVVLTQPVEKLGGAGDVATVSGGYARNYLIPRGLAIPARKGALKQADTFRRARAGKLAKEASAADELRKRLEAQPLRVVAQAGPDGRLFGSVTAAQIVQAIRSQLDIEVERHDVQVPDTIRHLGFHEATVRLHPEVTAQLTVEAVEE